jgi:hypothetical protein
MPNTTTNTEAQIATFARLMAKEAGKLRRAGKHGEAEALVQKSAEAAHEVRMRAKATK